MSIASRVRGYFGERGPIVIHECRNCGTTVDERTGLCPSCGRADIARYELE